MKQKFKIFSSLVETDAERQINKYLKAHSGYTISKMCYTGKMLNVLIVFNIDDETENQATHTATETIDIPAANATQKAGMSFEVHTGGILSLLQEQVDEKVKVFKFNANNSIDYARCIPAEDMVMLINRYFYVKNNDIRDAFINPHGKMKEE